MFIVTLALKKIISYRGIIRGNMKKYILLLILSALSITIIAAPAYQDPIKAEYDRLKGIRNDRMDYLLQKGEMPSYIKEAIENYQSKRSLFIQRFFDFYSSHAREQLKAYRDKLTHNMQEMFDKKVVMNDIEDFACIFADERIQSAIARISACHRSEIEQRLHNQFNEELQACKQNITKYKALIRDLVPKINNEVRAFEVELEKRYKQSVSATKEIQERYPQFDVSTSAGLARNNAYFDRISNNKMFRDTQCQICLESFETLGERITLVCGHSICPECLYQLLYVANANRAAKCPTCGNAHSAEAINKKEFPAAYLKKHFSSEGTTTSAPTPSAPPANMWDERDNEDPFTSFLKYLGIIRGQ